MDLNYLDELRPTGRFAESLVAQTSDDSLPGASTIAKGTTNTAIVQEKGTFEL